MLASSDAAQAAQAGTIAHRLCRHLAHQGWLEGEGGFTHPSDRAGSDDAMDALRMSSIIYRIATGAHAGCKVSTLHTLWVDADAMHGDAGQVGGFSLHAGMVAQAHERDKLERLCRYIMRPAIASMRLSISPQGRVRYELKTPWRYGTTCVEFEPIDCMAKPVALVPPPRAHLTRFKGIFAPNTNLRAQLTPSRRGRRPATDAAPAAGPVPTDHDTPAERRRSMTWAQRGSGACGRST